MKVSKVVKGFGDSLKEIATQLMNDEELCRLIYYSDDPLGQVEDVPNKNETLLGRRIIYNTEIPTGEEKGSYIIITFNGFKRNPRNTEVLDVEIYFDILTPTDEWEYRGPSLRTFYIMEKVIEIVENLNLKGVGGLDFDGGTLAVAPNSLSGYTLKFINYELGT